LGAQELAFSQTTAAQYQAQQQKLTVELEKHKRQEQAVINMRV
jgi:hypothetical protein